MTQHRPELEETDADLHEGRAMLAVVAILLGVVFTLGIVTGVVIVSFLCL